MFNLEQSIAEWRRQMLAAGIRPRVPLEELENHLREEIRVLLTEGEPEARAFEMAVTRLGNPTSVQAEFNKIKTGHIRPVKIGSLLWLVLVMAVAAFFARRLLSGKMNLLLYAHTLSVTAGYGAAFLLGSFGIYYVCWTRWRTLSAEGQHSLNRAVHGFSYLAAGLVITGTILGMFVSEQLFGRFWQWDPKEIGALCVALWLIGSTVLSRLQQIPSRAAMLMGVGGNIVVSVAWFGAGIFDYHHRRPGSGLGNYWPLAIFIVVHIYIVTLGMTRNRRGVEY
jgi:hypothetical protein